MAVRVAMQMQKAINGKRRSPPLRFFPLHLPCAVLSEPLTTSDLTVSTPPRLLEKLRLIRETQKGR